MIDSSVESTKYIEFCFGDTDLLEFSIDKETNVIKNTACVVYDESTGKYYYGRNGGYNEQGYVRNPELFGDSSHKGLLPNASLNKYPVGNCAEVDAVNRALNDGSSIANLHMTTIYSTKGQFGKYKKSCENCIHAFFGKVKINYSGWEGKTND